MIPITRGQRLFFIVICVAALLVAGLGLFAPEKLAAIFTWMTLPPLHARFVGSIYLFGSVFMLGCMLARRQAEVRWAVPMIGIWTGMLFIISVLHLDAFKFNQLPVWIWFASYFVYPLVALWIVLVQPPWGKNAELPGPASAGWAKMFFLLQGFFVTCLALLLFFIPGVTSTIWPWKVTPLLAQMYAGPLLSYGIGSLLYSREAKWAALRPVVPAMLAFTTATLVVSLIHRNLFSAKELSDWIWFGSFGIATFCLGALTMRTQQVRDAA
jgi:hypothetical protein